MTLQCIQTGIFYLQHDVDFQDKIINVSRIVFLSTTAKTFPGDIIFQLTTHFFMFGMCMLSSIAIEMYRVKTIGDPKLVAGVYLQPLTSGSLVASTATGTEHTAIYKAKVQLRRGFAYTL